MASNRRLFIAAAVLVAAAVWLPYWGFVMSAPQYPDESLMLNISHRGISGDVQEVTTLQQYIGVRFPEELKELEDAGAGDARTGGRAGHRRFCRRRS